MPFELRKWYLDCVTDDGAARIGYAAGLTTGKLRLALASALSASPSRPAQTRTRLTTARLPEEHDGELHWRVPSLGVAGRWAPRAAPLPTVELGDEIGAPGALTWTCLQPRAAVEWRESASTLRGVGYAERLQLRVPPWELPIEELHWGRAHVGPHTLVWIDWRGPRCARWLFVDGARVEGSVAIDRVRCGGLALSLSPWVTLRDGDLARTVFSRAPAVRALLSRHKLALHETKWLSRARVGAHEGFAIHEVVRWH